MVKHFMMPGPTKVPEEVLAAMNDQYLLHRSDEFRQVFREVTEALCRLTGAKETYVLPCSGTGAMEAALVNFVRPSERVLVCTMGNFGERFVKIAKGLGAEVDVLGVQWGEAIDAEQVVAALRHDHAAVFITHNETSTGVSFDLGSLAAVRERSDALIIADGVSSVGSMPVDLSLGYPDVIAYASQKGLMTPPGLGMVAVGERALSRMKKPPGFYFDFSLYRKSQEKYETPYTPAVSLWKALRVALSMIEREGLDAVYRRHRICARMTRAGVAAMGLPLFARRNHSDSVTSVGPVDVSTKLVRKIMKEKYQTHVAGGQGDYAERLVRIAHMGCVTTSDVLGTLEALAFAFAGLGVSADADAARRAALEVLGQCVC